MVFFTKMEEAIRRNNALLCWAETLRRTLSRQEIPLTFSCSRRKGTFSAWFKGTRGPDFDTQIRAMRRVVIVELVRLRVEVVPGQSPEGWSREDVVHSGPGFDRRGRWHVSRQKLREAFCECLPGCPEKSRNWRWVK